MQILGFNFGASKKAPCYTKAHGDLRIYGFRDIGLQARRRNAQGGGWRRDREEGRKNKMAIERSKQLEKLPESRSIGLEGASIMNSQVQGYLSALGVCVPVHVHAHTHTTWPVGKGAGKIRERNVP